MEWEQNATLGSSIGAPKIISRHVKHTGTCIIILKLEKFHAPTDEYGVSL